MSEAKWVRRWLRVATMGLGLLSVGPARAEVGEVRIGLQFGLIYLPVEVADAQGFFAAEAKKAGIPEFKVAIHRFSGSPAMTDALLSDNVDIGALGTPGLLIVWDKSKGHQEVAGLAALGANPFVLFTNKPEVKSFTDFTDKDQIAVPATTSPQAIVMRMAAEKYYGAGQFGRADKMLVAMPHPDATAALLSGRIISGYVATPPFISVLEKSDKVHKVITGKDIMGEEATGIILGAPKKFVDANPAVAKVLIAAVEDAIAFIAKEPDKAADVYIKAQSAKTPKDQVLPMLKDGSIIYAVAPAGVMKFATFMAKTGEIKNTPKSWQDVFFPAIGDRNGS